MVYFNIFSLFNYLFNSIRYRFFKHFKLFTILLLVFIIAFLFGTQSKATYIPNFENNFKDKYYLLYTNPNGSQTYFVCCNKNNSDNPPFYLRISNINGQNYLTAYNPRQFNLSYGGFNSDGSLSYFQQDAQFLYLFPSEQLANNSRVVANNFDVYGFINGGLLYPTNPFKNEVKPYFITTDNELTTFDYDYLQISGGTTPYQNEIPQGVFNKANFTLKYKYKGVTHSINILQDYVSINTSNNTWQINIPYNVLTNNVVIRNGENFEYQFTYSLYGFNTYSISKTGTYNLTSEQEDAINQDNNKQIQDSIYQEQQNINNGINDLKEQQQNITNSIDNMNNSLTDSSVDDSNVNDISGLSNGFSVTDNTGIDQLFQMVYDAFCTNQVEDIVFTIPFTNKQVTINQNNISNNFPVAIKNIVGIFVWGFIGLYVLKDIRSMINKISEGSPEDVGSDVKKEVL